MSTTGQTDKDRWEELQIDRLLVGLSVDEQVEYEALSKKMPTNLSNSFEKVVASIDVAWRDAGNAFEPCAAARGRSSRETR